MKIKTNLIALAGLAAVCITPVSADQYTENFSAPAKADGTLTGWNLPVAGFSVQSNSLAYDATTDKNYAIWTAAPVGTTITYTADVTASDTPSTDWSIAGIGIYTDDQNYWHLALVQAPDNMNKTHSCELDEMYNGTWGAQGTTGTILPFNVDTPGFTWETGKTYQFKIVLTPTQIQGQISDAGVVKFSATCTLSGPGVNKGRPMIDDAGIKATFTNLKATVSGS